LIKIGAFSVLCGGSKKLSFASDECTLNVQNLTQQIERMKIEPNTDGSVNYGIPNQQMMPVRNRQFIQCYYCGQYRHRVRECRERITDHHQQVIEQSINPYLNQQDYMSQPQSDPHNDRYDNKQGQANQSPPNYTNDGYYDNQTYVKCSYQWPRFNPHNERTWREPRVVQIVTNRVQEIKYPARRMELLLVSCYLHATSNCKIL